MSQECCSVCNIAFKHLKLPALRQCELRAPSTLFRLPNVSENLIRSVLVDQFFYNSADEWCCGACLEANSRSVTTFSSLKRCEKFDFNLRYTRILLTIQKLRLGFTHLQKANRGFMEAITKDSNACKNHKCSSCQG
jgi:hypothetical protein